MKKWCCKYLSILFWALVLIFVFAFSVSGLDPTVCPPNENQADCEADNCTWEEDDHGHGNFCRSPECFDADDTNETYCEALNTTFNLTFGCHWHDDAGQDECEPEGGDFFGDACEDFNGEEAQCNGIPHCNWNSTGNLCQELEGGFIQGNNPSCGAIINEDICINISGCAFANNACTGHAADGMSCSDLNKSICSGFTMLDTCCNWNGTNCKRSFQNTCYDNVPNLPANAQFCEDTGSFNNQTQCEKIAGPPWYMPCIFDNSSNECHFNGAGFGGGAGGGGFGGAGGFDEINTKKGCEAQNGVWKEEQYDFGGVVKTDTWCEFKFGFEHGGGNCDSACYACENGLTSADNTSTQAETRCEGSALGYCEYRADSFAHNGLGWCNPKQDFIDAGGKDCNDECSACDYLFNPESECVGSAKGCVFLNDSSANNGVGNCFGKNQKRCDNDCFSCYTPNDCNVTGKGGTGCSWDNSGYICKPIGFTGEICFDGTDNDNDGKVDCADSDCATDKFCGGEDLNDKFGDCPGYITNATCVDSGCVWLTDDFEDNFGGGIAGGAGHCDFPGANCFQHDTNATACEDESGCSYLNFTAQNGQGICEANHSLFDVCFQIANEGNCTAQDACGWNSGFQGDGGWCEPAIFQQCFGNETRRSNETACTENASVNGTSTQICGWFNATGNFDHGGGCEPICFDLAVADCTTNTRGLCSVEEGLCEPDAFGGKCSTKDGNETACTLDFNGSCSWFNDTKANNAVEGTEPSGWCDPKFEFAFDQFMGDIIPTPIANDPTGEIGNSEHDLGTIYLRDDFERFVFGSQLENNFINSSACNGVGQFGNAAGVVNGTLNYTFFWYLDSDGNTTNGCQSRDNSTNLGWEFSFRYQSEWDGVPNASASDVLTETKVSYQCINGSWGPVPIPLIGSRDKMCDIIGGGMAGVGKKEMFKFKNKFNKSVDLRIYASVLNVTSNDSSATDTAGPVYYSLGANDFEFEDCSNPGADADGDGLQASNDPDCFDFLKFGFVPQEAGFECGDGIDNDADGTTDCSDNGCVYDPFFCGGALECQAGDNKAPKIKWQQVNTFPDSAFVTYDTDEPANGTVTFYDNDTNCNAINKTIRDAGLIESDLPTHKLWHDGALDNFNFNPEALGFDLANATTYYFKTTVCDLCNNCAVSKCLNFTTKASQNSCKGCKTTFKFPFTAPDGAAATDPLGNLKFSFELPDGTSQELSAGSTTGKQFNYTQTKRFDLLIENPNITSNGSKWFIKFINSSVSGKLSSGVTNFSTADGDVGFNSTINGTFHGLGSTKCQEILNNFRPKLVEIGVPGNNSDLWQCDAGISNCTNITSNATRIAYNESFNRTVWRVSADRGC